MAQREWAVGRSRGGRTSSQQNARLNHHPLPQPSSSAASGTIGAARGDMLLGVIGHLEKTVIDCPDPLVLAQFYCQVLGMTVNEDVDGWVVSGSEPGVRAARVPAGRRMGPAAVARSCLSSAAALRYSRQ